jgi:hypothetical protein
MSASLADEPPRGGMAPLPLMALAVSASMPWDARGAHARRHVFRVRLSHPAACRLPRPWGP